MARRTRREGRSSTGRGSGSRRPGKQGTNKTAATAGGIVGFIILVIIILAMRYCGKAVNDNHVLDDMQEVIEQFDNYGDNKSYYDKLLRSCHEKAYDKNYSMVKKRYRFDVDGYAHDVMSMMLQQARSDGRDDVVAAMMTWLQEQ